LGNRWTNNRPSGHALPARTGIRHGVHRLTGDYLWNRASPLAAGEYRALNDPMARLKRVA